MQVRFKTSFHKDYRKLAKPLREKCDERLMLFQAERSHSLLDDHPLHGEYTGCRSVNIIGDYRAIYFEEKGAFWFIRVGTHAELYGK
jgi:addiction module RelE/StbE family toxin